MQPCLALRSATAGLHAAVVPAWLHLHHECPPTGQGQPLKLGGSAPSTETLAAAEPAAAWRQFDVYSCTPHILRQSHLLDVTYYGELKDAPYTNQGQLLVTVTGMRGCDCPLPVPCELCDAAFCPLSLM